MSENKADVHHPIAALQSWMMDWWHEETQSTQGEELTGLFERL